jgi:hypothetical protein
MDQLYLTDRQEKRLLRGARAAIQAQFPNPQRCGCPEPDTLRNLALRRIPLEETGDLVDHVATCAPCFDAYRHYRRNRRIARIGPPTLLAVIGVLALVLFWPHRVYHNPTQPHLAVVSPPPIRKVTIDYREFSTTRSGERTIGSRRIPHLRMELSDLAILLPLGTADGTYAIELRPPAGNAAAQATGTATWDGQAEVLTARVDLRNLAEGEYTLALREAGDSWRVYPVILEKVK